MSPGRIETSGSVCVRREISERETLNKDARDLRDIEEEGQLEAEADSSRVNCVWACRGTTQSKYHSFKSLQTFNVLSSTEE